MSYGLTLKNIGDLALGRVGIDLENTPKDKKIAALDKLISITDKTPTGCMVWQRSRAKNSTRGSLRINGVMLYSYKVIWELYYNVNVPEGWVLHHLCETPMCCNPEHIICMPLSAHTKIHRIKDDSVRDMILDDSIALSKMLHETSSHYSHHLG